MTVTQDFTKYLGGEKNVFNSDEVVVAIGSAQHQYEPNNPWTAEERVAMISGWADVNNHKITIVTIEDINEGSPPVTPLV